MTQSFANMHWPGLYSVVVSGTEPGRLSRLFVAKPGELHPDLRDTRRVFLHHRHAYDFTSTTVLGTVENDVFTPSMAGEKFHAYRFGSAMAGEPSLTWSHTESLRWLETDVCKEGESYVLDHTLIHRVVFHPCPRTGWFAVRIDERDPTARPQFCWAREYLEDVPYKGRLYEPITAGQAAGLLEELRLVGGIW